MAARLPHDPDDMAAAPRFEVEDGALAVHLVPMRRRHLRGVLRIEAQTSARPWSLALFMSELGLRTSRFYLAARVDGQVVGYGGLMFGPDSAHVTTIAVDPPWQRHKVATRLMLALAGEARRRGCEHLSLEVRLSNTGAQALYRRFGLGPAGIRKNYYVETGEDALVMWCDDLGTDAYAERLAGLADDVPGTTFVEEAR